MNKAFTLLFFLVTANSGITFAVSPQEFLQIYNFYRYSEIENKSIDQIEPLKALPFIGSSPLNEKSGPWIYSPQSETALQRSSEHGRTHYDAFWDLSPRAFFLSITDFIGKDKCGLWADMETGGEQDQKRFLVGYRILPFRELDIRTPVERDGKHIYPLQVRMKIYWILQKEPLEQSIGFNFDITKTNDSDQIEEQFNGRLLEFQLYFNEPIIFEIHSQQDKQFYKIESIGTMVGYGVWNHQLAGDQGELLLKNIESSHPDQLWNAAIPNARTYKEPALNISEAARSLNLVLGTNGIYQPENLEGIKNRIHFILKREGIAHQLNLTDMSLEKNNTEIQIIIEKIDIKNIEQLKTVFDEAGFDIRKINLTLKSSLSI